MPRNAFYETPPWSWTTGVSWEGEGLLAGGDEYKNIAGGPCGISLSPTSGAVLVQFAFPKEPIHFHGDVVMHMAMDSADALYATVSAVNATDVFPPVSSFSLLRKFSAEGTALWSAIPPITGPFASSIQTPLGVGTDTDRNVYVHWIIGQGSVSQRLAKYTEDGASVWNKTVGDTSYSSNCGLVVTPGGIAVIATPLGGGSGGLKAYAPGGAALWTKITPLIMFMSAKSSDTVMAAISQAANATYIIDPQTGATIRTISTPGAWGVDISADESFVYVAQAEEAYMINKYDVATGAKVGSAVVCSADGANDIRTLASGQYVVAPGDIVAVAFKIDDAAELARRDFYIRGFSQDDMALLWTTHYGGYTETEGGTTGPFGELNGLGRETG
jgi:hypothetical protein